MKILKFIALGVVGVVLCLALVLVGMRFLRGGGTDLTGTAAADGALVGLNTANTTIRGLAAKKPLYLNFWASWCGPCVGEMPAVEAMYKKYGDKISFAAVSLDENSADAVKLIESKGFTFPVYSANPEIMEKDYHVDLIPRSLLISADGAVLADHSGAMSEKQLEAFLEKALAPQK